MSVIIFTMTHKPFNPPLDTAYVPLRVGALGREDFGYLRDDTGENISDKNCYYGELSGLYWVWKNYRTDGIVGTSHYRRYLLNDEGNIFTASQIEEILCPGCGIFRSGRLKSADRETHPCVDVIASMRIKLPNTYRKGYALAHYIKDLEAVERAIKKLYPEDFPLYRDLVMKDETYFGNLFITGKGNYDDYMKWLFNIFFEAQKEIDASSYDDYHKRLFGFISEFLQLVYFRKRNWKVKECLVGVAGEKKESAELLDKIGQFLLMGQIDEAKKELEASLKKRPDLLMEASDVNGELTLAMEAVAVANWQKESKKDNILSWERRLSVLTGWFSRLNDILWKESKEGRDSLTSEESEFLCQPWVTDDVKSIAAKVSAVWHRRNC